MKPKEKAKELVLKFRQLPPSSPYTGVGDGEAKQCALIAVEEILKSIVWYHDFNNEKRNYWLEVKTEIEKL